MGSYKTPSKDARAQNFENAISKELYYQFSLKLKISYHTSSRVTAQKMKISIKDFLSKWSHLLKKSLIENFIFCAVRCTSETVVQRCSVKKMFLKISQNSQENTCVGICYSPNACNFIKRETSTQVFSWEFCETFKNIFFIKHRRRILLCTWLKYPIFTEES